VRSTSPRATPTLRVAFRHFYPDFKPTNFLVPLLEETLNVRVRITRPQHAALVFTSVYESFVDIWKRRLLTRGTSPALPQPFRQLQEGGKQVWITGENIRVPYSGYDLAISFDSDTYEGLNVYWPYILENLNWGFGSDSSTTTLINTRGVPLTNPEELAKERDHTVSDRDRFVCAFVGNPEPVRLRAIEELRKFGKVDVFGTAVGKPVKSKFEVARNYKFMLAFENDVYPGYVTEKPLESYACGCIPLWRGIDREDLMSPEAYINALDYQDLAAFAHGVHELTVDSDRLDRTASTALFNTIPSLGPLKSAFGALELELDS